MPLVAQLLHVGALVLGQHLRVPLVNAKAGRHVSRARVRIPREHHEPLDAQLAQAVERCARLGAQGVGDRKGTQQLMVDRKVDDGCRGALLGHALHKASRAVNALVLEDKVRTAYAGIRTAHGGRDAVCHHVVHLGVQLVLVGKPAPRRLVHDGARHAVREVLLDAGGKAKHVLLARAAHGKDALDGGAGAGERAGLV